MIYFKMFAIVTTLSFFSTMPIAIGMEASIVCQEKTETCQLLGTYSWNGKTEKIHVLNGSKVVLNPTKAEVHKDAKDKSSTPYRILFEVDEASVKSLNEMIVSHKGGRVAFTQDGKLILVPAIIGPLRNKIVINVRNETEALADCKKILQVCKVANH